MGIGNKNWGDWIRTIIHTDGAMPPLKHAWQKRTSGWIAGDSHEAANLILECFGLTLEKMFDWYGHPKQGVVYQVDLMEVCETLAPQLFSETLVA